MDHGLILRLYVIYMYVYTVLYLNKIPLMKQCDKQAYLEGWRGLEEFLDIS